MNSKIEDFLSYFIDEDLGDTLLLSCDKKVAGKIASKNKRLVIKTLFDLYEYRPDASIKFHLDHFSSDNTQKYALIIGDLPLGLPMIKVDYVGFRISSSWDMLYSVLSYLKDNGTLLIGLEPGFGVNAKSKEFIKLLNKKGYNLDGLLETPKDILQPYTRVQPTIAIFSKRRFKNNIFIASLDESENISTTTENLIYTLLLDDTHDSDNFGNSLELGDNINLEAFHGFDNYRITKEIEILSTHYKEFSMLHVIDDNLFLDIKITREFHVEEKDKEYIYIPIIGKMIVHSNINSLDKKHQNYFQVLINTELASSLYLEKYFKSELAQLTLKGLFSGGAIPKINKVLLENIIIPIPSAPVQKNIISSYKLLGDITSMINDFENELSINPKNSKKIQSRLTDTLIALNELSKEDEIQHIINKGESLTVEFKQTFSKDVNNKGTPVKEIQKSSLKNIVGFLNKSGGILLIGVTDDSKIYGIENDNYQSDDKYLLNFKNKLNSSIEPKILEYIDYEIISIEDKKVLVIRCKKSEEPVYLMPEGDFYVRTNPATDKLNGQKLGEYIKKHFSNVRN